MWQIPDTTTPRRKHRRFDALLALAAVLITLMLIFSHESRAQQTEGLSQNFGEPEDPFVAIVEEDAADSTGQDRQLEETPEDTSGEHTAQAFPAEPSPPQEEPPEQPPAIAEQTDSEEPSTGDPTPEGQALEERSPKESGATTGFEQMPNTGGPSPEPMAALLVWTGVGGRLLSRRLSRG